MATSSKLKSQPRKKQPATNRLLRYEVKKAASSWSPRTRRSSTPQRGKLARFVKLSKRQSQKRDRYGRFTKATPLTRLHRQQPPKRDKYGRFTATAASQPIKRDKHGRFSKKTSLWRRRAAVALPLVILGLLGILFFVWQLNKPIEIKAPAAANSIPAPAITSTRPALPQTLSPSEPTRLRISKIGVDTTFVSLGQKTDGTMEVPKQYNIVGWYNKAPTPGELGPSVVVGHVDRPGGIAVFWRLRELLPGDIFEIDRADGKTVQFKVDEVKQLPQDSFPTDEVYGNIDHAGIRLITCGGTFNRSIHRYSHNTVVYGSMVIENTVSASKNLTL